MKNFIVVLLLLIASATSAFCSECPGNGKAPIFPEPQKICLKDQVALPSAAKLDIAKDAPLPDDIRARYVEWLAGASVSVKDSGAPIKFVRSAKAPQGSSFREEGYEIEISGNPAAIKISALSDAGFLYALFTLMDMTSGGKIYSGTVEDFPRFAIRGVLEGGYSVWGHQQRLDVIKWIGQTKMNVFMYGPKEGHFFRRRWREPFSPAALEEFRQYVEACKRDRVRFMMALSPALSIEHSNPEEIKLLVAKYRQIQDLGVQDFAIFFDDVLPVLSTPADKKAYKHIAEAEADVTNNILAALKERDPKARLAFVPRQYWGWTPTKYIEILRNSLKPEIEIGWTGIEIVSEAITKEDAEKFTNAWGRPPAIGDNFSPFGPLVKRAPDLYKATSSFTNNPYGFADDDEAQLSKFVNSTIADYGWNPEGYEPERSFTMSVIRLAGDPKTADELLAVMAVNGRRVKYEPMIALASAVAKFEKGEAAADGIRDAFKGIAANPAIPGGPGMNPLLAEQLKGEYAGAAGRVAKAKAILDNMRPGDAAAIKSFKDALSIK